jgi:hypothetical protein
MAACDNVHFPDELLLCLWAQVAMHGGLDLEQVLDDVFEVVCVR